MRVAASIVEFNPLHSGHLYLLSKIRPQCDVFVLITSSYYSQRGLPSLLSPEQKTKLALMSGADLVLELPACYSAQSAFHFAKASIQSLNVVGVTDLYFGSESLDKKRLEEIADHLDDHPPVPGQSIRTSLDQRYGDLKSNDILGLCYIYWARKYGIECHLIQRQPFFASATSIRENFFNIEREEYKKEGLIKKEGTDNTGQIRSLLYHRQSWKDLYPYLRMQLIMSEPEELEKFLLVDEGIEHRLQRLAQSEKDWNSFLEKAVTAHVSKARIQRTALMILLQVKKETLRDHPDFDMALVLGLSRTGRAYLKSLDQGKIFLRLRDYPPYLLNLHFKCRFLYGTDVKRRLILFESPNHPFR